MKYGTFCLLMIFGLSPFKQISGQWIAEKCPTKDNLNSISFSDDGTGWIVGNKGSILMKSSDGWKLIESPTAENLYSVTITDKNNIWAVGAKGTIIHFNGERWERMDSPTKWNLYSVSFNNRKKGLAVGEHGTILLYDNGKWELHENKLRANLLSANCIDNYLWIGGGLECVKFPIIQMPDNKKNLSVNYFNSDAIINSIMFLNPAEGWAVGSPSTILHYTGTTWETPVIPEKFPSLKSVFFSDIYNGISAGYGGTIMIFKNNAWTKESHSTNEDLNGVSIINGIYYAVGNKGTILKRDYNKGNNTSDIPGENATGIEIFPNPCDDKVNILLNFNNPADKVDIIITTTSGKIIMEKEHRLIQGNSELVLSTDALANGLYLLQVVNGNRSFLNKILVNH
ncbi:MAG TPA: YCF48-related protein [Bacteroidales bacterium]|nr:YCF48-related protein [Bacteroidales bacterium]